MTDGTRRRLAWTLSLLVAAPCLAAPRGAAAIDAELRSRQLYKQGETLANDGNWVEACPLFQAAHDLHGTGGTALRTADCYEKVGKYDRALALYQYIVDHRDTDKSERGERVALAEQRVAALKKQLGLDQPAAPAPVVTAIEAPPPPPSRPPPPPSRGPAVAMFGVAAAGLVVGGVAGGLALKQASQVKAVCVPNTLCPSERPEIQSTEIKAWVANAGFAVAVAGAVVGVVYLVTASSPKAQAAARGLLDPAGVTLHF